MKWISVKAKRPKIGADVLVFGSVRIDEELVKRVTHWMPLPENPE